MCKQKSFSSPAGPWYAAARHRSVQFAPPTERGRHRYFWLTTLALAAAIAGYQAWTPANAQLASYDRVRVIESPRPIGNAELIDHEGKSFDLGMLRGKVAFVFFGFTNCPDVCPLAMQRFRELHNSGLVDNDELAYVLISVDGERDTPAAMKEFLAQFSPDFIGLTEAPELVQKIAAGFSASFFKGTTHPQSHDYGFTHSSQVFAVDTDGNLRAELYSPSIETMAAVASDLLKEAR